MAKEPSTKPSQEPVLKSDPPLIGHWDSAHTTIGAGVAIFHLASSRVVLCYHTHHHYWFLPKGRRDANEDTGAGAEREGFEESGYRNRLLPLPLPTCQPRPHNPSTSAVTPFVTEPVWTQLAPVSRSSQYILFWYIAETVPPDIEGSLSKAEEEQGGAYQYPPKFDADMTFKERIEIESESGGYEPIRHENTGVDEEEAFYESQLVPVEEALKRLRDAVSCDVVSKGWEAIKHRKLMEAEIPAQEHPYLDTIPDDRGEDIKNRVRERHGSDSEGRPIKRARADISALLPPGNDEQNIEDPPKPESDLNNYDRERLQKGLRYITEAAKKKITPRTQEFLKLHKDACKAALEAQVSEEASRAVVQAKDQVYHSAAFYLKPRSSEEYERLMLYLKLRRLEFMAKKYEKVLLSIQEEYFDVMSRDEPQYWIPNEKARKLTEDKLAREKKRAQK